MKFKNESFIKSAYSSEDFPRHRLPEFAFVGRSNVGKSSLLNKVVGNSKLARVSSRPGRTQCINFYNINHQVCLVDLPGYGFARVPDKVKEEWRELINDYLYQRQNLRGIIHIVDARHKPTDEDVLMAEWLMSAELPTIVAATKVDKISRNKYQKQKKIILNTLALEKG
ncbi:MAG: ribosome biogenesis GTP-binding protein YihA/YsxC [Bacillota bacterium]